MNQKFHIVVFKQFYGSKDTAFWGGDDIAYILLNPASSNNNSMY